jgi:hypothetical protein
MYHVNVQVIGSDTGRSIKNASLYIRESGIGSMADVNITYRDDIEAYQVELPGSGVYELDVQKKGYQDVLQEFSISSEEVAAENSGNIYVLEAFTFALNVEMQAIIVINEVFIFYINLTDPFHPYPLDTHEIEIKVVLQVLYGSNLSWYSDSEIAFDNMSYPPHWITGSRGPLHKAPIRPIDGFSLEDTPTLNDRNERVHQWPLVWPTPRFCWIELVNRGTANLGGSNRNYSYDRNPFDRLEGWKEQLQLAPGTKRFQVEVKLQGVTVFSADKEYSTRISVRDSNTPGGCNDRVTEYLRWLTAFLEVPYEWGGDWFGGKIGNNKGGGTGYEGYGIDCSALVSCGAQFAGFNWVGGYREGKWKYTTSLLNNISDEIGNEDIKPGDILNNSRGGHVVTVFRIVNRTNVNNIQIEIIEASPAGKVRKKKRSLQNYYTNRNYTLRRIGLSILSVQETASTVTGEIIVKIEGTRFKDPPTVYFGKNEAVPEQYIDTKTIRVILIPELMSGPVDVTITNPDGESFTLKNGFTYTEP